MKKPIAEQNMGNQNLLEIVIFLSISILAFSFRDFNIFESCSEPIKQFLGYPPQACYVSMALSVYLFSAFTIRAASIFTNVKPIVKWSHLGYRTAFFFFYALSGSVALNFYPVFFIGIFLYSLDQFHISYYNIKGQGVLS